MLVRINREERKGKRSERGEERGRRRKEIRGKRRRGEITLITTCKSYAYSVFQK